MIFEKQAGPLGNGSGISGFGSKGDAKKCHQPLGRGWIGEIVVARQQPLEQDGLGTDHPFGHPLAIAHREGR